MRTVMDSGMYTIDWYELALAGSGPDKTYRFDDLNGNYSLLNGVHEGIDFGQGNWLSYSNFEGRTRYAYFSAPDVKAQTFTVPAGKVLKSIVVSGTEGGAYTISDGLNPLKTGKISSKPVKISTGWTKAASIITLAFTVGADSMLRDITYGMPLIQVFTNTDRMGLKIQGIVTGELAGTLSEIMLNGGPKTAERPFGFDEKIPMPDGTTFAGVRLPVPVWLITGGERVILVDTGMGSTGELLQAYHEQGMEIFCRQQPE